ncbi:hypothetical protein EJV47_27070 [Hymenobacter gummosus]|uniref:Uncharacterized protein n=1 Tax=Hymenobacter gummosus TaxID=1776032 RepID=A0A3S0JCP1_9BACT|nr:hypothetical protein [Hymenobacter gummosus]RTQ44870.1 hypothetical protein EJV47_27070 [Hymenobacter gummosus]
MPDSPVYLTIQAPCQEAWARMTPTACGRFCQSCQKEVLDFTDLAPADILAIVRSRPAGSVCGRIPADTLAASRQQAEAAAQRRPWPGAAPLRQLLAALALPLLTPPAALAQSAAPTQLAPPTAPDQPPRLLRVRVLDAATNAGLGLARVELWRLGAPLLTAQTEVDGTVQLAVPAEYWAEVLSVKAELPGFPGAERSFTPAAVQGALALPLTAGPVPLPQVRTVGYIPPQRHRAIMGGIGAMTVYERPSLLKRVVVYPPWRLYLRTKRLARNLYFRLRD